jgi:hypothetical protein
MKSNRCEWWTYKRAVDHELAFAETKDGLQTNLYLQQLITVQREKKIYCALPTDDNKHSNNYTNFM